jgi:OOP family OmpA-OmpF porin
MLAATPLANTQAQSRKRAATEAAASRVSPAKDMASLEGAVLDATSKQPIAGATVLAETQSGAVSTRQTVGADGVFKLTLDPKQSYTIKATAAGYEPIAERMAFTSSNTTTSTSLRTNNLYGKFYYLYRTGEKPPQDAVASAATAPPPTAPVTRPTAPASTAPAGPRVTPPKTLDAKVVYTPPLIVAAPGKTTQLRAIQFVQSKADFLPDAQPALEQLADFLRSNPTAEIELAGHTDNQGDFDENVRLSKQRVDVVKAYLVANGIAASRITTRGYGPTRPIGSNNAETTRQLNRRVEMTILKP